MSFSAAIIHYYMAGQAIGAKRKDDVALVVSRAEEALKHALGCNPSQPQLWYMLYWLEASQGNAGSEQAQAILLFSYQLGPHEGWISSHRSRTVLSHLPELSPELRAFARAEFVELARDNPARAVTAFEWQHEPIRNEIASWLGDLSLEARREFARRLKDDTIDIPGVIRP